jgi:hypothetical protein
MAGAAFGELDGGVLAALGLGRAGARVVVRTGAGFGCDGLTEERTASLTAVEWVGAALLCAALLCAALLCAVPSCAVHPAVAAASAATASHALGRNGRRAGRSIRQR